MLKDEEGLTEINQHYETYPFEYMLIVSTLVTSYFVITLAFANWFGTPFQPDMTTSTISLFFCLSGGWCILIRHTKAGRIFAILNTEAGKELEDQRNSLAIAWATNTPYPPFEGSATETDLWIAAHRQAGLLLEE
ncbi:MAG: hypothetical protein K0S20_88 [Patescibacteria group bacterium]|jgi:hypothetical protein|nr:hypothetical protein [Patescibacteria group bacterium]